MNISQANNAELPEMISLLKASLGESLMPKSEEFFLWKHEKNSFGRSKILIAKDEGKIVGLRAFMHWSWANQEKSISAVRAVDTATDPAFQGKGIFSKLTMQAVEECKTEGVGMVFNSPNPISMKGYLKMGWVQAGKMPICIGPGSLFPRTYDSNILNDTYYKYPAAGAILQLPKNWKLPFSSSHLVTPIDYEYLNWRYSNCPVIKYGACIESGRFGFVFRLKKINRFIELRICEAWTEENNDAVKQAAHALKCLIKEIRPLMISCAPSPLFAFGKKMLPGMYGPFKKGPMTTVRPLAMNNLDNFTEFSRWQPSIGSLELF